MQTASLVVDLKCVRCSQCKMLLRDVTVLKCPHCDTPFDRVSSNHVGLAAKVQKQRDEAVKANAQSTQS